MATPTTIAEAITQTALNPKIVGTNKGRTESHELEDLLKAANHDAAQTAAGKNHFGLRTVKLIAPGAG